MIKLALWIVFALVVSALVAWLIALPGTITFAFGGLVFEPRMGVAILMAGALAFVVIVVWTLLKRLFAAPGRMARARSVRRKDQGYDLLTDALIALEAGDPLRARLIARDAQSKLGGSPAAKLLEARAEIALGDLPAARELYRGLIANDRTALAALSGLYAQARAQERPEAALTFARKALALDAGSGWASQAVFDDLVRNADWSGAIVMINDQNVVTREGRARKRRIQAVIETARAREAEASDPASALEHALTALRIIPDFVPAALIAARIQSGRGEVRRAASLLRRVWRATEHPQVGTLYTIVQPGASAAERLKRAREIIELPPPDRDTAIVYARAAIDAFAWDEARAVLRPYLVDISQGVATLMAEIEEGEHADQARARDWLTRAVRAPRDPAWTADGVVADDWQPVSPVTGKLDAFEWKVPVTQTTLAPAAPAPVAAEPAAITDIEAPPRPLPLATPLASGPKAS